MRDFGLELYGNALLANPQFMQANPETVRKFVRASIRGFLDAAANPKDAVASVLKRNPVTNENAEMMRFAMFMNDNFFTDEVKKNGVGHVDSARLARSVDQIGESFKYTNKQKVADFYTGEFLPPASERAVPPAIASKKF